ncbi:LPP20 family lipoprotein [candidate division KSB1 bacterium]|nr:LPP20 family lipoprotein [candidate division KSB1 bacterium]
MKISRVIALLAAVILMVAMTVNAQWGNQATQSVGDNGMVNWSNQVIRATGIGAGNPNLPLPSQRATAIRAAKLDAWRNLLETIQGVSLTSETTVRNAMVENDVIQTRVQGILKGFTTVGEPKYLSDGSVEVTVEMPLTGALTDALLPTGQGWGMGQPMPTPSQPTNAVFTGLIIDAKGLGLRPAMAPKVLDEAGNEVYGSKVVSREWAVQMGMVGYDKEVTRAKSNDRVTDNPLIVKAVKVSGPNKADVVVSAADAATIQAAAANQNFLDKCKVMFLVD